MFFVSPYGILEIIIHVWNNRFLAQRPLNSVQRAQFALVSFADRETKDSICYLSYERMSKKLFVGNLDWGATEEQLQSMFAEYGQIEEAVIIKDKVSGRSKGFGFVTYANDEEAEKAIAELDGKELNDRPISVNEARPPQPRA